MELDYSQLNVGQVYYGEWINSPSTNYPDKYFFKYLGDGKWTSGRKWLSDAAMTDLQNNNKPYQRNTGAVKVLPWPTLDHNGHVPQNIIKTRPKPSMRCLNPV